MDDRQRPGDVDRRLANLQAVARHHSQRGDETQAAAAAVDKGTRSNWRRWLATLGPIGVVLALVLGKAKFLVPLLKFTKLSTLLTMVVAIWAYAMFWGLP